MARRRNRRGEGSVSYDRTNRCWWARVSLGVVNGKRVVHKARAATEEDARRELDKLRRIYLAGGDPARQTLDAYLVDWLASHGPSVRASTRTSYTGHVDNHIRPLLGGILVGKLRPSDVRRLVADRTAAGLSPATVGRIVTTLHIAMQRAVDERAILDNPVDGVRLPSGSAGVFVGGSSSMRRTLEERVSRRTTRTRTCWLWTGAADPDGYGIVKVEGRARRLTRVVWEMAHGPIPAGLLVLHSCDTPACVRPDHLMVGTQRANIRDMLRKGRRPAKATA